MRQVPDAAVPLPVAFSARAMPLSQDERPELLQMLAKLVLRHDQDIRTIKLDTCFHLYAQTGPGSIIPILYRDANKWKSMKEKNPAEFNSSLRETLMRSLLGEMQARLQKCKDQPEPLDFAKSKEWLSKEGGLAVCQMGSLPTEAGGAAANGYHVRRRIREWGVLGSRSFRFWVWGSHKKGYPQEGTFRIHVEYKEMTAGALRGMDRLSAEHWKSSDEH